MTSVAKGIVIEIDRHRLGAELDEGGDHRDRREIPVVVTTRCANGPTIAHDVYPNKWDELIESGIHFENHLDSYKARTRLILTISLGREYEPFHVAPI